MYNIFMFLTFFLARVLCAVRMLSLSRAVVSGVTRAPAAISQGGVSALTRFNSTGQVVRSVRLYDTFIITIWMYNHLYPFSFTDSSKKDNIWASGR